MQHKNEKKKNHINIICCFKIKKICVFVFMLFYDYGVRHGKEP